MKGRMLPCTPPLTDVTDGGAFWAQSLAMLNATGCGLRQGIP